MNRFSFKSVLYAAAVLLILPLCTMAADDASEPDKALPNIIFIMVDDLIKQPRFCKCLYELAGHLAFMFR